LVQLSHFRYPFDCAKIQERHQRPLFATCGIKGSITICSVLIYKVHIFWFANFFNVWNEMTHFTFPSQYRREGATGACPESSGARVTVSIQGLKVVSMDRLPPINGRTRQSLEQAPSNTKYNGKRVETVLARRLRNSYSIPGQHDEQMRALLQKLAAKLRESPPEE
jgi:hypothetical protein